MIAGLLAALLALSPCACAKVPNAGIEAGEPVTRPPTGTNSIEDARLSTDSVEISAGQHIAFAGKSTLPDGTRLQTGLLADGELEPWWPDDALANVQSGAWRVSVPLGQGAVPATLDRAAQYTLQVRHEDEPEITSEFHFDLAGPPTPSN